MNRSVRAADSVVPVLRSFAVRGVVEGFYGTPWTHDARLEVISFLAARGMNAYAYAPKDDARHRAEWREPYESADLEHFRELAAHGAALGVQFGFAISPGLDIHYESDTDRQTLLRKLAPLRDAGVSWFLLLLDDIPMQPGLALRQAALVTWLHAALAPATLADVPDGVRRDAPVALPFGPRRGDAARGRRHVDRAYRVFAAAGRGRRPRLDRGARGAARHRLGQLSRQRRTDDRVPPPRSVPGPRP